MTVTSHLIDTGHLIDTVLDELSVTDTVYHDLAYSRPLSARVLGALSGRPPSDQTLLVGPNVALAQALLDQNRAVEIWHVPGVAVTENMRGDVTRTGDLDALFGDPGDAEFDVVVLPYVLDAVLVDPPTLLETVRRMVRPGGTVVATLRRPGGLDARLRAMAGRSVLRSNAELRHSWSWPSAAPRRCLDTEALRRAAHQAGFRLTQAEPVVDVLATAGVDALPLGAWLRAHAGHAAKRVVQGMRDTLLATLEPIPEASGSSGPEAELPRVSVVVLGNDDERMFRVLGDLDGQTYPRDLVDVRFATPDAAAANAAVREATGEIVAFTDALSHPPAGWVESGVRALSAYSAALAGGVLAEEGSAAPFLAMPDRKMRVGGLFLAANSFYRRDALLAVGGFDETVGRAWGWDGTAATRLRRAGFPVAADDTAFVFRTYPYPADRSWIGEEYGRARDLPSAVRRDPALRRGALDHRLFASARTLSFDVALLGGVLGAARRKPTWAAVLAAPWAGSIFKYVDLWPPSQWGTTVRNVRGMVLRDLIWLAGFLVGSARARRVVL
jgi:hypothetical protein